VIHTDFLPNCTETMFPAPSGPASMVKQRTSSGGSDGKRARGGTERWQGKAGRPGHGHGSTNAGRVDAALLALAGPTLDLESLEFGEKAFSSRARLYIGNLAPNVTEDRIKEMFKPYGKVGECYINKDRRFAFVRMETRAAAEKAKRELNGKRSGDGGKYVTFVRFAPTPTAVKVTGLSPSVTNELLAKAFSVFGSIERCLVYVDSHGRSKEEGIVEFESKSSAENCTQRCTEQCFFLTATMKPVEVELIQNHEDDDGFMENMAKMAREYITDRQRGPRLVGPGSFEHDFGKKWKELRAAKKEQLEGVEREFKLKEERLLASLECSKYAFETDLLRKELMAREANLQRNLMRMTPSSSCPSIWEDPGRGNPFSPRQMPSCPPPPAMSSQASLLGTPPSLLGEPPSMKYGEPKFPDGGMEIDRGPTHDGYGDGDDQKRPRRF